MNPRRTVATAALFGIVLLAACDQGRRGSRAPVLTLRPAVPTVARGDVLQMYVVATYPDGRQHTGNAGAGRRSQRRHDDDSGP